MKISFTVLALLFLAAFQGFAQEASENSQDLSQFDISSQSPGAVKVSPDLVELAVELDPVAYGFRGRTRTMQVNLEIDPVVMGRIGFAFQYEILSSLMLDIPAYFESYQITLPLGKAAGLFNNNLESYWGAGAGIGLKWRISEWFSKSSIYLAPRLKVGYYSQKGIGIAPANAISLTPELILGWERVFDTGFVIGANLGVEKLFTFPLQRLALPYVPVISINPNIQLGYAW